MAGRLRAMTRGDVVYYRRGTLPDDFGFTGQRKDSYMELLDYGTRRYDPILPSKHNTIIILWRNE